MEGRAGDKNQKGVWWDVGKESCMKGFYDTGSPKQNISPQFLIYTNMFS